MQTGSFRGFFFFFTLAGTGPGRTESVRTTYPVKKFELVGDGRVKIDLPRPEGTLRHPWGKRTREQGWGENIFTFTYA